MVKVYQHVVPQCHLPGLQEDSRAELLFPFRREDLPVSFSVRMPDSGGYAHFLYVPCHADFWDFLAHELTNMKKVADCRGSKWQRCGGSGGK